MSFYAIGIGGTGAKCLEALTHLCASGLLPGDLMMIFVDPDKSNGSLERAAQTAKLYQLIKDSVNFGSSDVFGTNLTIPNPNVWSPFEDQANPRLDEFFKKAALDKASRDLFDVLYTRKEQETTLEKGFRGHPSIGSAVFADKIDLGNSEPWATFKNKLASDLNGGEGRIFLFGSIFGGTGASGFPTIAKLIRNELVKNQGMIEDAENIRIGGALMLPYFAFNSCSDSELKARSEEFLVNSQAALKYYYQRYGENVSKLFDAFYVLGDQDPQQLGKDKTSLGGSTQKNVPHFVELYAALAALDFYKRSKFYSTRVVNLIARDDEEVNWSDLPEVPNVAPCRQKLGQMIKFCFAFLNEFYPVINSIKSREVGETEPWYIDFFKKHLKGNELSSISPELEAIRKFCERLLLWTGSLEIDKRTKLVEASSFSFISTDEIMLKEFQEFNAESFPHLILPADRGSAKNRRLIKLLESMCDAYPGDQPSASFLGNFISTLYGRCEIR